MGGLLGPNYGGIGRQFARGAHTNDPNDRNYEHHWNVVPGSLGVPFSSVLVGQHFPDHGTQADVNVRVASGEGVVFLDVANPVEAADGALKLGRAYVKRTIIDPVEIPISALRVFGKRPNREIPIPRPYGGGVWQELPHALPGRINHASPREQIDALFDRLRRRRPDLLR